MSVVTKYGTYEDSFAKYVRPTALCDFDNSFVKKQGNELNKSAKTALQAINVVHEFISSFPDGFDREDKPASYILNKGRGQCNTKTTLMIALLRAMGVPARVHAWKIFKIAHKGHFNSLVHLFTPKTTLFTYPEIYYKDKWLLLSEILCKKEKPSWESCPFDDAASRKKPLKKEWIAQDLGSHWHPDDVYKKYGTNASGWRRLAFPIAQILLNRK